MFKKINRIYQLQNFKDIINLLEGLEYFPFYGTLLGLVRENNILEMDDDIDILINKKHRKKLISIIEKYQGVKLDLKSWPNNCSKHLLQATRKVNGIDTYIDFYLYDFKSKDDFVTDKWNIEGRWEEENMHLKIPKELIFPLKKKEIKNFVTCNIPNKEVDVIKFLFGDRWMFPLIKNLDYYLTIENNKPKVVLNPDRIGMF